MRYLVLILTLLSLSINVPSAVADEATKRAKIENIIKMWNLDEEFKNYKDACVASYNLGSPEILVRNNPDHFDGIKPGSPDWDKIVIAWNKYVGTSCGFMNARKYKEEAVNSLSAQLDETNANDILAFTAQRAGRLISTRKTPLRRRCKNIIKKSLLPLQRLHTTLIQLS